MVEVRKKDKIIAFFLFLTGLIVYFLSKEKDFTSWNHYIRLAYSFLHGKLYLLNYQPYLEAAYFKGKHYPVSPPMPAFIALPFVFLFGQNIPQPLFSFFFGALNGALLYLVLLKLKIKPQIGFLTAILLLFGTNHWYLASVGSYWYLAHIIALTFMLLSLNEFFSKKRMLLVGLFCGFAFWTRLSVIGFPLFFLLFLLNEKESFKKKLKRILFLFIPFIFIIILHGIYNLLRYGVVYDWGYLLIPHVLEEPWYQKGIFHHSYLPRQLKLIFFGLPEIKNHFPFIYPHLGGISLFITTPAFILVFLSFFLKEKVVWFSWISLIVLALPSLFHGSTGISQFGYRFSLDFIVPLLILTAKVMEKLPFVLVYFLVIVGILFNWWGVYFLNKL